MEGIIYTSFKKISKKYLGKITDIPTFKENIKHLLNNLPKTIQKHYRFLLNYESSLVRSFGWKIVAPITRIIRTITEC